MRSPYLHWWLTYGYSIIGRRTPPPPPCMSSSIIGERGRGPWTEEARWKFSISVQKFQYLTPIVVSFDFSYNWHYRNSKRLRATHNSNPPNVPVSIVGSLGHAGWKDLTDCCYVWPPGEVSLLWFNSLTLDGVRACSLIHLDRGADISRNEDVYQRFVVVCVIAWHLNNI